MLPGILSRRLLITFLLFVASIAVKAQFSYRFELLAGKSFFSQSDKITSSQGYINFYENTKRQGDGTVFGLKYNLKDAPVSLFLGYEKNDLTNYSFTSDIEILDQSQELQMKSADLDIQYLFFNRSTFKPYVFAGVSFNNIDYSRTDPSYNYPGSPDKGYIQVDKISWEYYFIQTRFNAPGLNLGTGLHIRLTDQIGIYGNFKLRYISQNQTKWMDDHLSIKSYNIGIYYRLLKRKNNILL